MSVLSQDEIKATLTDMISGYFGIAREKLTANRALFSSALLSSIQLIQMIALLEEKFGITIPTFEVGLETFDSIDAMSLYVAGQLSAR